MGKTIPDRSYPAFTRYEQEGFKHCRLVMQAYELLCFALDPMLEHRLAQAKPHGTAAVLGALAQGRRPVEPFVVYAMADRKTVKVGITQDLEARFCALRKEADGELHLVAYTEGLRACEQRLHKAMMPWHVRGEWFKRNAATNAIITEIKRTWMVPDGQVLQQIATTRTPATDMERGPSPYLAWAVEKGQEAIRTLDAEAAAALRPTPSVGPCPENFLVEGLDIIGGAIGCDTMQVRKRLIEAKLWGDSAWMWVSEHVQSEQFYRFRVGIVPELFRRERQGILGELHRRERGPMFGGGEA